MERKVYHFLSPVLWNTLDNDPTSHPLFFIHISWHHKCVVCAHACSVFSNFVTAHCRPSLDDTAAHDLNDRWDIQYFEHFLQCRWSTQRIRRNILVLGKILTNLMISISAVFNGWFERYIWKHDSVWKRESLWTCGYWMLPTPASTLPQSMHPSTGPRGWHLAYHEPSCCKVNGTWFCVKALHYSWGRTGCASHVPLLSLPGEGGCFTPYTGKGYSLLRQGAETLESAESCLCRQPLRGLLYKFEDHNFCWSYKCHHTII